MSDVTTWQTWSVLRIPGQRPRPAIELPTDECYPDLRTVATARVSAASMRTPLRLKPSSVRISRFKSSSVRSNVLERIHRAN